MFVVRYLIAVLALIVLIVAWGVEAGLGLWRIVGMVGLGVLGLQGAVLALVVVLAFRARPREGDTHTRHLVILPK